MSALRIGVVSAHYPPNFVSGGTLLPQRFARALAARGHTVHVFAGWLGRGRTPLQAWDEVDETGLPVRWLNVDPFLGWHDSRNFDNAPARDAIARWLADTAPDIVHLHSMQGLGALVPAAAREAGARVVVTMHDFWWVCARQFLVDRDFRPCGPSVMATACQCEVNRDWADARLALCLAHLHHVDAILTPSEGAARVLAANGVPDDRLRVDPNGYEAPRAEPRADSGPVHFAYTGGPNPLKGVGVLLDAVGQLHDVSGWRLRLYGVDAARFRAPPQVEFAATFPADELPRVLGDTDVLVVPSLAQETSSLTVLEALGAGVPVVSTATPGPQGVIEDGVNGLIVAIGDERALAHALRRIIANRDLLQRLRVGCVERRPEPVSIADQVARHERLYRELFETTTPQIRPSRSVQRVLLVAGMDGAPLRYRVHQPAEGLRLVGVEAEVRHYLRPDVAELAERADVVVLYRVPSTRQVLDLIERARERRVPVLFDADDLIFDPELAVQLPAVLRMAGEDRDLYLDGVRRYRTTLEACDGFIASTDMLAAEAARLTGRATARFDNGVGVVLGRNSDAALRRSRSGGPLRVGYFSGTDTHGEDWLFVQPALVHMLDRHRSVELWLGGLLPPTPELARFGRRVRRMDWVHWTRLPAVLRDLDVNLAPLTLGRFNEAKSAIKWMEAALTATPTVASPTGPFREAIEHGRTGWLAEHRSDWAEGLDALLLDQDLRREMGRQAREAALLRWPPHLQGQRYVDVLERATDWQGSGGATSVAPELAPDEPPWAIEIEPYGLDQVVVDGPRVASPARRRSWRRTARRIERSVRDAATSRLLQRTPRQ